MNAVHSSPKLAPVEEDNHVFFHGMTWKDFEVLLAVRGDCAGPRLLKREIYRRLAVRELWTFQRDGKLVLRVLEDGASGSRAARSVKEGRYVERTKSKVLPKLDIAWLVGFLDREPQSAAVRALRDDLRKKRRR